jgi:uncharacterized protein
VVAACEQPRRSDEPHAHQQPLPPLTLWRRITISPFLLAIRAYQLTLSPFIGNQCRFYPTCSRYSAEAYRLHGVLRGTWLTLSRLLRCHPFGGHGYDPPPPPKSWLKRRDADSTSAPTTPVG